MPTRKAPDKPVTDLSATAAMSDLQAAGFGTMAAMGTVFAEAMNEIGTEAVRFMARRLEQDMETRARIFSCTDIEDLRAMQTEFVRTSLESYSAETGRMLEISDRLMTTAVARVKG